MSAAVSANGIGWIIINRPEQPDVEVLALASAIAAAAPLSVRASKAAISVLHSASPKGYDNAAAHSASTFNSHDYAEGRRAFMEKRKPVFEGK